VWVLFAIDFIGEENIAKDGARVELEFSLAIGFYEDLRSNDITGKKVGGELNTAKVQVQCFGQGVNESCFAKSRNTFQKDVTTTENGDEDVLDNVVLADNEFGDFLANGAEVLGEFGSLLLKIVVFYGSHWVILRRSGFGGFDLVDTLEVFAYP